MLAAALNPVGYLGGGGDDWPYLVAAECWAKNGFCLPHDHWSARWPLVAPVGGSIALFGGSRASVSLVPFLYAAAALLLVSQVAGKLFARAAAVPAAAILAFTPVFSTSILTPNVDVVELTFLLCALAAWLRAASGKGGGWAFAGGAAFALAVQSRETSLAYAAAFGLWFLLMSPEQKRATIWAVPGFVLPTILQMLIHWALSGDPLLRLRLALAHARIPSTELAAHVDRSRSPLFNPDFIAGWKPAAGIDVQWLANPVLNLLASPAICLTLLAPLLLFLALRDKPFFSRPAWRHAALLIGAATLGALLLIYGFAIDPKPRMFLPLAAASAIGTAALGASAWAAGERRFVSIVGLLVIGLGLPATLSSFNTSRAGPVAAVWVREAGDDMTVDVTGRRILALVPSVRGLPVNDPSRPLQLEFAAAGCSGAAETGRAVTRAFPLDQGESAGPSLCLFRKDRGTPVR